LSNASRSLFGAGALGALLCGITLVGRKPAAGAAELAGKALFTGGVPLKGRIVGHQTDLPPMAVRCSNCHSSQPRPASDPPAGTAPSDIFAAQLSRAALLENRPRRGGPASRYDQAAFCRVLREGIDPANVMVAQTMPRYLLSEKECGELWAYTIAQ
jgi:hypothetical protein